MGDFKNKFQSVLRDDENVLWTGNVNKKAYTRIMTRNLTLIGLFPLCLPFVLLSLTLFLPLTLYIFKRSADRIFFCVTDKQIIKRKGYFTPDYQRLALSSIGEIQINTSILDSQQDPESAALIIMSKNFASGENIKSGTRIHIYSLNFAHEAYKIISKHSDNEALKIKKLD